MENKSLGIVQRGKSVHVRRIERGEDMRSSTQNKSKMNIKNSGRESAGDRSVNKRT